MVTNRHLMPVRQGGNGHVSDRMGKLREWLTEAMRSLGIKSHYEFAKVVGMTRSGVDLLMSTNTQVRPGTLRQIESALGLDTNALDDVMNGNPVEIPTRLPAQHQRRVESLEARQEAFNRAVVERLDQQDRKFEELMRLLRDKK